MKYLQSDRRDFLRLLLSLPAVLSVGLEPGMILADDRIEVPGPVGSFEKLIYSLGPWSKTEREKAEDFAGRFLKHTASSYLTRPAETINRLAGRFSSEDMAMETINLKELPPEETQLLTDLLEQLYTLVEVRFHVLNEPPQGECLNDRLRYTRPPA